MTPGYRHHDIVRYEYIIHRNIECSPLDCIELRRRLFPEPIILWVGPTWNVASRPVICLLGNLPTGKPVHMCLWVGRTRGGVVHLHVGVEVRVGIWVAGIAGKVHTSIDGLDLYSDTNVFENFFDNGLSLLANGIDRSLVDELQPLALFDPHPIASALPPCLVQQCRGFLRVELP